MCLVCGHVGCGRYERSHGLEHFRETSHTYAVDLVTQRVWDYAGDGFVHRLLENGATGKMVEASAAAGGATSGYESSGSVGDSASLARSRVAPDTDATLRAAADEKREALAVEYSLLLTSQLEAQRQWFEGRRREAEEAAAERESALLSELEEERGERQKAEARLASRQKEKRLSTLTTARLRDLEEEVAYLRELNKQLTADQRKWKADVERHQLAARAASEKAEARVAEMEAQARDLMFYLEMQDKLDRSVGREGMEGAAVLVTEEATVGRGAGVRRRGGGGGRRGGKGGDKHARFKAKQVLNTAKAARAAAQAELAAAETTEAEPAAAAAASSEDSSRTATGTDIDEADGSPAAL
jgi:BRCA1-associated protein